jgi:hypothetical protein
MIPRWSARVLFVWVSLQIFSTAFAQTCASQSSCNTCKSQTGCVWCTNSCTGSYGSCVSTGSCGNGQSYSYYDYVFTGTVSRRYRSHAAFGTVRGVGDRLLKLVYSARHHQAGLLVDIILRIHTLKNISLCRRQLQPVWLGCLEPSFLRV